VNTLVRLSDNGVDTLEERSLGGPIAGGARAVLFSSKNDKLVSSISVSLSGIKDSHLFA